MGIFLTVLIILYALFFCFPAFMFVWEGSTDDPGCYGLICLIVGFPGALLALLTKGIAYLCSIPIEREREEEIRIRRQQEEDEKRQKLKEANEQVSKLYESIKGYLNVSPLPTKIFLYYDHAMLFRGDKAFRKINYGTELPFYCSWRDSEGDSNNDEINLLHLLAKRVNQGFNNAYNIHQELRSSVSKTQSLEAHFLSQDYIELWLK